MQPQPQPWTTEHVIAYIESLIPAFLLGVGVWFVQQTPDTINHLTTRQLVIAALFGGITYVVSLYQRMRPSPGSAVITPQAPDVTTRTTITQQTSAAPPEGATITVDKSGTPVP